MPQSLAQIVLHIVFSTKNRVPWLRNKELRGRLHAYMAGVANNLRCEPILINGVDDHIHLLSRFSRTLTVAQLVEETKSSSSKWMKEQAREYSQFYWQRGYGAFSVGQSDVVSTRDYVARQEDHHRKVTFQDEFRALCRDHEIELDERYAWD